MSTFIMLDHMIILGKYLAENHGNGFYRLQKLFLVMDSIGPRTINIEND